MILYLFFCCVKIDCKNFFSIVHLVSVRVVSMTNSKYCMELVHQKYEEEKNNKTLWLILKFAGLARSLLLFTEHMTSYLL